MTFLKPLNDFQVWPCGPTFTLLKMASLTTPATCPFNSVPENMQSDSTDRRTPSPVGQEHDSYADADTIHYDSFFSLRRPRDLRAGMSSGGKSMLKGFLAGTLAVLAGPAVGVWQDGWKGLPKGVALGADNTANML